MLHPILEVVIIPAAAPMVIIISCQVIDMATIIILIIDGNQVEMIKAIIRTNDLITIVIDPIRLQTDHMVVIVWMIVVMLQWTLAMRLESRSVTSYTKSVIVTKIAKLKVNVLIVASLDIMPAIVAVLNRPPTSKDIIILCRKKPAL